MFSLLVQFTRGSPKDLPLLQSPWFWMLGQLKHAELSMCRNVLYIPRQKTKTLARNCSDSSSQTNCCAEQFGKTKVATVLASCLPLSRPLCCLVSLISISRSNSCSIPLPFSVTLQVLSFKLPPVSSCCLEEVYCTFVIRSEPPPLSYLSEKLLLPSPKLSIVTQQQNWLPVCPPASAASFSSHFSMACLWDAVMCGLSRPHVTAP